MNGVAAALAAMSMNRNNKISNNHVKIQSFGVKNLENGKMRDYANP